MCFWTVSHRPGVAELPGRSIRAPLRKPWRVRRSVGWRAADRRELVGVPAERGRLCSEEGMPVHGVREFGGFFLEFASRSGELLGQVGLFVLSRVDSRLQRVRPVGGRVRRYRPAIKNRRPTTTATATKNHWFMINPLLKAVGRGGTTTVRGTPGPQVGIRRSCGVPLL